VRTAGLVSEILQRDRERERERETERERERGGETPASS